MNAKPETTRPDFQSRRIKRMQTVDMMDSDLRRLVHEWGLSIVQAFLDCGVRDPRRIQHLIKTVIDETRAPRGRASSMQGAIR